MFRFYSDSTTDSSYPANTTAGSQTAGISLGIPPHTQRFPKIGTSTGLGAGRLAKGAALLGCALACAGTASAQFTYLQFGTISYFSGTATSGSTTGSHYFSGAPSSLIYSPLTISSGSGNGIALALNIPIAGADVVGMVVNDPTANSTGGASGSFTMNFTASVLFFDIEDYNANPSPNSVTTWSATGFPTLISGQAFNPGSYTFNFVTSHAASSTDITAAAVFVSTVPETPLPIIPVGAVGVMAVAGSLRRRRSQSPTTRIPLVQ
jgi:hypothetical protein